jgi:hypothetical protein
MGLQREMRKFIRLDIELRQTTTHSRHDLEAVSNRTIIIAGWRRVLRLFGCKQVASHCVALSLKTILRVHFLGATDYRLAIIDEISCLG